MIRLLPTVALVAGLALATAAPASADRVNDVANDIGGAVCVIVGADPTFHGINSIGHALNQQGFTDQAAGRVIALSVSAYCPWHQPLIDLYTKASRWRSA
ncbi:DUF732 domain-containing protein [Mycobacteroides abscessus]|uniref:DUF732 domain-containing protein n=1 Tax=Mycobacteroides abscessus TaxID=36809 RepID=UPI0009D21BD3|nr:DUF732 domain-containing protein [Mycobacteroides abscessus]SKF80273.1 bacteriophage protein [Mycobacteroides abscessus subsp. bolletii]SKG79737.1 bacteriophage protein [Mycobacteroides abscessus subsp. bolletii]SKG79905.1 bacteriophage protein [Mycobacteroides abscessus subsp. bolletii]SKG97694.1 bacteriophage protein [Mycobacteroides abscessus subsp. bolletii]SKH22909.1 bacteriophage protein [Mycobacteroides abscessus subsp. bolletii]